MLNLIANIAGALKTPTGPAPTPVPVVGFFAVPTGGTAGETAFQFTDTSTNSPTSWLWDFGSTGASGNTSLQNPVVYYPAAGTFTVSLAAANAGGTGTPEIKSGYITVAAAPVPPAPLSIEFNTSFYYTPTEAGLNPLSTDFYYNPNIS